MQFTESHAALQEYIAGCSVCCVVVTVWVSGIYSWLQCVLCGSYSVGLRNIQLAAVCAVWQLQCGSQEYIVGCSVCCVVVTVGLRNMQLAAVCAVCSYSVGLRNIQLAAVCAVWQLQCGSQEYIVGCSVCCVVVTVWVSGIYSWLQCVLCGSYSVGLRNIQLAAVCAVWQLQCGSQEYIAGCSVCCVVVTVWVSGIYSWLQCVLCGSYSVGLRNIQLAAVCAVWQLQCGSQEYIAGCSVCCVVVTVWVSGIYSWLQCVLCGSYSVGLRNIQLAAVCAVWQLQCGSQEYIVGCSVCCVVVTVWVSGIYSWLQCVLCGSYSVGLRNIQLAAVCAVWQLQCGSQEYIAGCSVCCVVVTVWVSGIYSWLQCVLCGSYSVGLRNIQLAAVCAVWQLQCGSQEYIVGCSVCCVVVTVWVSGIYSWLQCVLCGSYSVGLRNIQLAAVCAVWQLQCGSQEYIAGCSVCCVVVTVWVSGIYSWLQCVLCGSYSVGLRNIQLAAVCAVWQLQCGSQEYIAGCSVCCVVVTVWVSGIYSWLQCVLCGSYSVGLRNIQLAAVCAVWQLQCGSQEYIAGCSVCCVVVTVWVSGIYSWLQCVLCGSYSVGLRNIQLAAVCAVWQLQCGSQEYIAGCSVCCVVVTVWVSGIYSWLQCVLCGSYSVGLRNIQLAAVCAVWQLQCGSQEYIVGCSVCCVVVTVWVSGIYSGCSVCCVVVTVWVSGIYSWLQCVLCGSYSVGLRNIQLAAVCAVWQLQCGSQEYIAGCSVCCVVVTVWVSGIYSWLQCVLCGSYSVGLRNIQLAAVCAVWQLQCGSQEYIAGCSVCCVVVTVWVSGIYSWLQCVLCGSYSVGLRNIQLAAVRAVWQLQCGSQEYIVGCSVCCVVVTVWVSGIYSWLQCVLCGSYSVGLRNIQLAAVCAVWQLQCGSQEYIVGCSVCCVVVTVWVSGIYSWLQCVLCGSYSVGLRNIQLAAVCAVWQLQCGSQEYIVGCSVCCVVVTVWVSGIYSWLQCVLCGSYSVGLRNIQLAAVCAVWQLQCGSQEYIAGCSVCCVVVTVWVSGIYSWLQCVLCGSYSVGLRNIQLAAVCAVWQLQCGSQEYIVGCSVCCVVVTVWVSGIYSWLQCVLCGSYSVGLRNIQLAAVCAVWQLQCGSQEYIVGCSVCCVVVTVWVSGIYSWLQCVLCSSYSVGLRNIQLAAVRAVWQLQCGSQEYIAGCSVCCVVVTVWVSGIYSWLQCVLCGSYSVGLRNIQLAAVCAVWQLQCGSQEYIAGCSVCCVVVTVWVSGIYSWLQCVLCGSYSVGLRNIQLAAVCTVWQLQCGSQEYIAGCSVCCVVVTVWVSGIYSWLQCVLCGSYSVGLRNIQLAAVCAVWWLQCGSQEYITGCSVCCVVVTVWVSGIYSWLQCVVCGGYSVGLRNIQLAAVCAVWQLQCGSQEYIAGCSVCCVVVTVWVSGIYSWLQCVLCGSYSVGLRNIQLAAVRAVWQLQCGSQEYIAGCSVCCVVVTVWVSGIYSWLQCVLCGSYSVGLRNIQLAAVCAVWWLQCGSQEYIAGCSVCCVECDIFKKIVCKFASKLQSSCLVIRVYII